MVNFPKHELRKAFYTALTNAQRPTPCMSDEAKRMISKKFPKDSKSESASTQSSKQQPS